MEINPSPKKSLPWWTWVVPLLVFQLGTQIALHFRYVENVSAVYLPIPFAIIFMNWWGIKRVAPALYINSLLSTPLWGVTDYYLWFLLPIPETLLTFISWQLFNKWGKGKFWLPNTKEAVRFLWLALIIPLAIDLLMLQTSLTLLRHHPAEKFLDHYLRNLFGELSISISLTFGLLYLLSPRLQRLGWLQNPPEELIPLPAKKTLSEKILLACIYAGMFIFSLNAPIEKFWFVYGLFTLSISLRFGFGEACFCNLFVFIISFVLPAYIQGIFVNEIFHLNELLYFILFGNLLMSLFAALTGRVISDLRFTDEKLQIKNQELQQTNEELDLFVYSVSHDLSAPLKSVQGLVNVSRLDNDLTKKDEYLQKISQSVNKLDRFIQEVLEYSQNKRLDIRPERISLSQLIREILSNLEHLENYRSIRIDISKVNDEIVTDHLRLKMILNNLISNAVKFQKTNSLSDPFIHISTERKNDLIIITIEDNGEGIKQEIQSKIFDMFYRGTLTSKGSGLGLFIAKEAALKLGGDISVESEYGKGSIFRIALKRDITSN